MRTTLFNNAGHFVKKDNIISFVPHRTKTAFKGISTIEDAIAFDTDFSSVYIGESDTISDLAFIFKHLVLIERAGVALNTGSHKKVASYFRGERSDKKEVSAHAFITALLAVEESNPLNIDYSVEKAETSKKHTLVDYATCLPKKETDILLSKRQFSNYKSVYPKTFDSWITLLSSCKAFNTRDKELLQLKNLFTLE